MQFSSWNLLSWSYFCPLELRAGEAFCRIALKVLENSFRAPLNLFSSLGLNLLRSFMILVCYNFQIVCLPVSTPLMHDHLSAFPRECCQKETRHIRCDPGVLRRTGSSPPSRPSFVLPRSNDAAGTCLRWFENHIIPWTHTELAV